jgi:glycosyltransferase involved in cell wall biosynthesis
MKIAPGIALVINTFNQPDYLARVLAAVSRQVSLPAEVLLADDGSAEETRQVINAWKAAQSIVCEHVWQPNEGFRRSRILNRAIAQTHAEYIVFLDGDTVPHPHFISDHGALAAPGIFIQGHRALIEQQAAREFGKGDFATDRWRALRTLQLRGVANAFHWPGAIRSFRTDLRGIRGCNLGIWRADLLRVNGYNEAFTGWGREDAELALRLMNSGVRRCDARGWALCYHLWHPPASRAGLPANDELLAAAVKEKRQRCEVGLDQYLTPQPK